MQLGFFFDQSRCIACHTCAIACKDWNNLPVGVSWRRVTAREEGKFPRVSVVHLSLSCLHCSRPLCLFACPTEAIFKREEDGVVLVDRERCLPDCMACLHACPYDIPQFGADGRMQKCDFCLERRLEGKGPACVEACPMRALDSGPLEELRERYGGDAIAPGLPDPSLSIPSLVVRPRRPMEV